MCGVGLIPLIGIIDILARRRPRPPGSVFLWTGPFIAAFPRCLQTVSFLSFFHLPALVFCPCRVGHAISSCPLDVERARCISFLVGILLVYPGHFLLVQQFELPKKARHWVHFACLISVENNTWRRDAVLLIFRKSKRKHLECYSFYSLLQATWSSAWLSSVVGFGVNAKASEHWERNPIKGRGKHVLGMASILGFHHQHGYSTGFCPGTSIYFSAYMSMIFVAYWATNALIV